MVVSILQWNIWYQEDARNIGNLLQELNPDIICLQEMTRGYASQPVDDVAKYLADLLGYQFYAREYPLNDDGVFGANGIFSRYPILTNRSAWILPEDSPEPRLYIESKISTPEGEIIIGTTHMLYTDAFVSTAEKVGEADALIKEISRHKKRYILTGDFNATPDSYTVNQIKKHLQNIGPDLSQPTWTTKPFSYNGFEANTLDWRLDYCFATQDVKPLSTQIIHTKYSDHLPIICEVRVG